MIRRFSSRHVAIAGFAALSMTTGSVATAQIDAPPEMIKGVSTERLLADAAACLVRGERARAVTVVSVEPGTLAEGRAILSLLDHGALCFGAQRMTKAPDVTWRGAIAEALYLRSFRGDVPVEAAISSSKPQWLLSPQSAGYAVAQCAAARDTAAADRLVRSAWRSEDETRAINAFLPTLNACSNGRKVRFDRVTIHGMVAEGLFRVRGGDIAGGKR